MLVRLRCSVALIVGSFGVMYSAPAQDVVIAQRGMSKTTMMAAKVKSKHHKSPCRGEHPPRYCHGKNK